MLVFKILRLMLFMMCWLCFCVFDGFVVGNVLIMFCGVKIGRWWLWLLVL